MENKVSTKTKFQEKSTDYCTTIDVTYVNKITRYENVKKFEIEPIYNGIYLDITDKNGITESCALYNEVDENWKIELRG